MKNAYNEIKFKYKRRKNFMSVLIPVYNDSEGIKVTLNSLKNQSLDRSQYEVIVANDGGDQQTEKICKKYKARVINILPNKGSYNARNVALKESRGEYIAFIDADIHATKTWLKDGLRLLKKYDYVGGAVNIDEEKLETLAHYYEYLVAFDNEKKLKKYHYIPTANLMVKREVIERLGGFDRRLWSGGDNEFGDRVFRFAKHKMFYSKDLKVIHPPRGKEALAKKSFRTAKGLSDLVEIYPDRFSQYKSHKVFNFVKGLFTPPVKVILSRRRIGLLKRITLFFWSIYFELERFVKYR